MNTSAQVEPRSRWGRSRFGGSGGTLIAVSLGLGAILASGIGWLSMVLESGHQNPWLIFWAGAIVSLPASAGLAWVLLVDRSTLAGAPADPDASVEARWYEKAAVGAFHVLIASLGLGAAVVTFLKVSIHPGLLLGAYFSLAAFAFAVIYQFAKRTDS